MHWAADTMYLFNSAAHPFRSSGPDVFHLSRPATRVIRLHADAPVHPGIVVATFDSDFVALAQRIDAALKAHAPAAGKLIRVNRPAL
ncbi:MAG: hypothetical protein HYV26_02050 [Candidatus Hydrogenedentes bacterium]|nr:hypothetical protein [Candidatus Hydrogenedentota bacterium]